jgi:uncharacterized protein DUF5906
MNGGNLGCRPDRLKSVISAEEILVNPKYGRHLYIRNCANFYFTSNHPDPLFIDESEKRYFIHESRASELTKKQVSEFIRWRDQGGCAKLLRWLLDYKIASSFNPNTAPVTEARRELADAGLSDLQRFAREIVEDPYGTLAPTFALEKRLRKIDLWDAEQIISAFRSRYPSRSPTTHALGNALRSTRKIWKTKTLVPDTRGRRKHVWIVHNFDAWRAADLDQLTYEYQRHDSQNPKRYPIAKNASGLP